MRLVCVRECGVCVLLGALVGGCWLQGAGSSSCGLNKLRPQQTGWPSPFLQGMPEALAQGRETGTTHIISLFCGPYALSYTMQHCNYA
jgi:hypothetical protein